jgi:hypothetical protein
MALLFFLLCIRNMWADQPKTGEKLQVKWTAEVEGKG